MRLPDSQDIAAQVQKVVAQPLAAAQSATQGVLGSLSRAASSAGVDFGFLVRTAHRESSLNPQAKARTSSAAGLFQFIEQTWLGTLKTHGAKYGYGAYADQISKGANGRYYVNDPQARQTILGLRYNAEAASHMAAEMTAGHAAYLKGRLGRNATQAELYAAHFLGPAGAGDLATAVSRNPNASAATLFPQAAAANRSIFYSGGKPVSVTGLMANLGKHTSGPVNLPVVKAPQTAPAEEMPQTPDDLTQTRFAAQLHRIESERALLQLAFGTDNPASSLFTTQLLSGFAPEKDDADAPLMSSNTPNRNPWG